MAYDSRVMTQEFKLPSDPKQALAALQEASAGGHVVVFKHSPVCPVSHAANHRFNAWLKDQEPSSKLQVVRLDVISQRQLARGLVAELEIDHESPQVLWFTDGQFCWHESHAALEAQSFDVQLQANLN